MTWDQEPDPPSRGTGPTGLPRDDEPRTIYDEALEALEGYCELCEVTGHTFRTCPRRDDATDDELELDAGGRLARDEYGRRPGIPNDPVAPWRDPY